jgi:PKD repeat protein
MWVTLKILVTQQIRRLLAWAFTVKKGILFAVLAIIALAGAATAQVSTTEWYPKFNHYNFICDQTADRYNWFFGDGNMLMGVTEMIVYHAFTSSGIYDVVCQAIIDDEVVSESTTQAAVDTVLVEDPTQNQREVSVEVRIKEGFPQETDYVFICENDFEAVSYTWNFGDGQQQVMSTNQEVYHRYNNPGTYTVTCTAASGENTQTGSTTITVEETTVTTPPPAAPTTPPPAEAPPEEPETPEDPETPPEEPATGTVTLTIAEHYPQNGDYVFICENDFEAHTYDWDFGNGHTLTNTDRKDVFQTYEEGNYTVTCTAHSDDTTGTDNKQITVTTEPETPEEPETPPQEEPTARIVINESFSMDHNYVFHCETEGIEAALYHWYFGDGTSTTRDAIRTYVHAEPADPEQPRGSFQENNVFHSYSNEGNYQVTCTAEDAEGTTVQGETQIQVHTPVEVPEGEIYTNEISIEELGDGEYRITCDSVGFEATGWRFIFGNVDEPWVMQSNTRTAHFEPGEHQVVCVAGTFNGRWSDRFYEDEVHYRCEFARPCVSATTSRWFTIEEAPDEPEASVELRLVEGFPYDHNYAFECVAEGFEPTSYTFDFGDGTTDTKSVFDAYHTYTTEESFDVTCVAHNEQSTASSNVLNISVESRDISSRYSLFLNHSVEGNEAKAHCQSIGFEAHFYDFIWRDDEGNSIGFDSSILLTEPGEYSVSCTSILTNRQQLDTFYEEGLNYHDMFIGCSSQNGCLPITRTSTFQFEE